jgi:hypothetical protein
VAFNNVTSFAINGAEVQMRTSQKYRSISNFTTVAVNGTTAVTLALDESPAGKVIGLVFKYNYMGSYHEAIIWLRPVTSASAITLHYSQMASTPNTTSSITFIFNFTFSTTTITIDEAYTQTQNSSTSSADSINTTTYFTFTDVITLD